MFDDLHRPAPAVRRVKHVRLFAIAAVFAVLPFGLSIGASAAAPTTNVTKELSRKPVSDALCMKLTKHTGCYSVTTLTTTAYNNSAGVQSASAFSYCEASQTLRQAVYSSVHTVMAAGNMRFTLCFTRNQVQLVNFYCWVSGTVLYGGSVNNCYSPAAGAYQTDPTWSEVNWYFYPYPMPWWHITNVMEASIYIAGGGFVIYECNYC
jgi:hypothetical protein